MSNDTPTLTTNPRALMDTVKESIRAHLPEVAADLLAWRHTGILPDGKFREIAALLNGTYHDYLAVAENFAVEAALEAVSVRRG